MLSRRNKQIVIAILLSWLISPPTLFVFTGIPSAVSNRQMFVLAELTIDHPPDLTFENGTRGKTITWNATDPEPKNFTVTRDGEVYDSGPWDGGLITVDLDHLYTENLTYSLPRTFSFVCTVFNQQNESISDEVLVTVIPDETAPVIVQPENITYEEGSFGHYIHWNITETNPDFYNVTRESNDPTSNFTVIEAGDWDGRNISINIDGLNATYWYLYTLFVNDTLGHNATSTVNVTVFADLTNPVVSSPNDISYEYGATGNKIVWNVYDSNPKNYTIIITYTYINKSYGYYKESEVPLENITQPNWQIENPQGDKISVSIDHLYVGNYTYNITLFDKYGHWSSDAVNVTVYPDVRAPIVNATPDYSYEEGYTGYSVNWSIEENNPLWYNLTRDGIVIASGNWTGQNFSVSADGLEVGVHIFNLTLSDYFNQTTISLVNVTVTPDAHLPLIEQIQVIQSFNTVTENNLTIQAYVWDLNNISSVKIEWTLNNETIDSKNMTSFDTHFYYAEIGAFPLGSTVYYRIIAVDNSSVQNVYITEWHAVEIRPFTTEPTPALLWVPILLIGFLATIVILVLYTKTRTR